jgi:hypothetical protein
MKTRFHLPPSNQRDKVEEALQFHHEDSEDELIRHSYGWTRIHYFLQGVRNLNIYTTNSLGSLPEPTHVDERGKLNIRIDKAVSTLQTEVGRLLGVDINPRVIRPQGVGLDLVRSNALSQVVLDNFVARFDMSSFKIALMTYLSVYGSVGVGAFENDTGPFGCTLMLVPPWELRSVPGRIIGTDQVAGVEWSRWVPFDWLKKNYGSMLNLPKKDNYGKLNLMDAPPGSHLQGEYSPSDQTATHGQSGRINKSSTGHSTSPTNDVSFVQMKEWWVWGDDYSCLRWCIMLGDHLALDYDYTNPKTREELGLPDGEYPIAPLWVARYLTVPSFYGRGLMERLIDLNKHGERLYSEIVQDIREANSKRFLSIPATLGINHRNLNHMTRNGVIVWQPDYSAPNLRPEVIAPATLGEVPGKAFSMTMQLMDSMSSQGPLQQGKVPGRLQSAGGLAIVADQQNIPLAQIGESLNSALQGVWKAALSIIRGNISNVAELSLTRLDESMVGLRVNRETGTVQMDPSLALPPPQILNIQINQKAPRSKEQVKEQLDMLLQAGLISKVQYRIAAMKEGLDLPFVNRAEYENYTTAWLENITMFGDGQTPGETITHPETDNHVIHMMVVMEFMGSHLFRLASPPVKQAFLEHKAYHLQKMGTFPEELLDIDQFGQPQPPGPEAANMAMSMMAGGPGQTPPPEAMEALA